MLISASALFVTFAHDWWAFRHRLLCLVSELLSGSLLPLVGGGVSSARFQCRDTVFSDFSPVVVGNKCRRLPGRAAKVGFISTGRHYMCLVVSSLKCILPPCVYAPGLLSFIIISSSTVWIEQITYDCCIIPSLVEAAEGLRLGFCVMKVL